MNGGAYMVRPPYLGFLFRCYLPPFDAGDEKPRQGTFDGYLEVLSKAVGFG